MRTLNSRLSISPTRTRITSRLRTTRPYLSSIIKAIIQKIPDRWPSRSRLDKQRLVRARDPPRTPIKIPDTSLQTLIISSNMPKCLRVWILPSTSNIKRLNNSRTIWLSSNRFMTSNFWHNSTSQLTRESLSSSASNSSKLLPSRRKTNAAFATKIPNFRPRVSPCKEKQLSNLSARNWDEKWSSVRSSREPQVRWTISQSFKRRTFKTSSETLRWTTTLLKMRISSSRPNFSRFKVS